MQPRQREHWTQQPDWLQHPHKHLALPPESPRQEAEKMGSTELPGRRIANPGSLEAFSEGHRSHIANCSEAGLHPRPALRESGTDGSTLATTSKRRRQPADTFSSFPWRGSHPLLAKAAKKRISVWQNKTAH